MIFHVFFAVLHTFMATLFGSLPSWNIKIGTGCVDNGVCDPATDHNVIHYGLQVMGAFDRFMPVHDGFFPIVAIAITYLVGMLAFKGVMTLINLVRGSGG